MLLRIKTQVVKISTQLYLRAIWLPPRSQLTTPVTVFTHVAVRVSHGRGSTRAADVWEGVGGGCYAVSFSLE